MSGERYPDTLGEIAHHPQYAEPFVVVSETASLREPTKITVLAQAEDKITALEIVDEEKEEDPGTDKRFHILLGLDGSGNRLGLIIGGNED